MPELETMEIEVKGNSPLPISQINTNVLSTSSAIELAHKCLEASTHWELRHLKCEHREGILVIRGRVSSYYQKQLAQELIRGIRGVEVIRNAVEVVESPVAQVQAAR